MLEPPVFPEPVVSMANEPAKSADQARLSTALGRLRDEDPTLQVRTLEETRQCQISGMGELHLEVIREKLLREHGIETIAGGPEMVPPTTASSMTTPPPRYKGCTLSFTRAYMPKPPLCFFSKWSASAVIVMVSRHAILSIHGCGASSRALNGLSGGHNSQSFVLKHITSDHALSSSSQTGVNCWRNGKVLPPGPGIHGSPT